MRIINTLTIAACSILMLAGCKSASEQACCCCPAEKEMNIQLYSARDLIGDSEKYAENHGECHGKNPQQIVEEIHAIDEKLSADFKVQKDRAFEKWIKV